MNNFPETSLCVVIDRKSFFFIGELNYFFCWETRVKVMGGGKEVEEKKEEEGEKS